MRGSAYDSLPDFVPKVPNLNDDYQQAVDDLTKSIELKPNYAEAYGERGKAYNNLGDYQQAIKDCTKAIELKPDYADAYYYRGFSWAKLNDFGLSSNDYKTAARLGNNAAQNVLIRAGIQW